MKILHCTSLLFFYSLFTFGADCKVCQIHFETPEVQGAVLKLKKEKFSKAFKLFMKQAESGNAEAQHAVALMYEEGLGTVKDLQQAANWFFKSVKGGNIDAKVSFGYFMDFGPGYRQSILPENHGFEIKDMRVGGKAWGRSMVIYNWSRKLLQEAGFEGNLRFIIQNLLIANDKAAPQDTRLNSMAWSMFAMEELSENENLKPYRSGMIRYYESFMNRADSTELSKAQSIYNDLKTEYRINNKRASGLSDDSFEIFIKKEKNNEGVVIDEAFALSEEKRLNKERIEFNNRTTYMEKWPSREVIFTEYYIALHAEVEYPYLLVIAKRLDSDKITSFRALGIISGDLVTVDCVCRSGERVSEVSGVCEENIKKYFE